MTGVTALLDANILYPAPMRDIFGTYIVALTARAVASLQALVFSETFAEPMGKFGLADLAGCDLFHHLHRLVHIEGEAMAVFGQEYPRHYHAVRLFPSTNPWFLAKP